MHRTKTVSSESELNHTRISFLNIMSMHLIVVLVLNPASTYLSIFIDPKRLGFQTPVVGRDANPGVGICLWCMSVSHTRQTKRFVKNFQKRRRRRRALLYGSNNDERSTCTNKCDEIELSTQHDIHTCNTEKTGIRTSVTEQKEKERGEAKSQGVQYRDGIDDGEFAPRIVSINSDPLDPICESLQTLPMKIVMVEYLRAINFQHADNYTDKESSIDCVYLLYFDEVWSKAMIPPAGQRNSALPRYISSVPKTKIRVIV